MNKELYILISQNAKTDTLKFIDYVNKKIYFIDWTNLPEIENIRLKEIVIKYCLQTYNNMLFDTEEIPEESPAPLIEQKKVTGMGYVSVLTTKKINNDFVNWLDAQQWLALAIPQIQSFGSQLTLHWTTRKLFENPTGFSKILEQFSALFGIVSYYDGDSWLISEDN